MRYAKYDLMGPLRFSHYRVIIIMTPTWYPQADYIEGLKVHLFDFTHYFSLMCKVAIVVHFKVTQAQK